ncbi:uncharacterized protein LOC108450840 [Gossypium arboreum]|uniref:uncharacterized protein LOC108450840 n=1 Tax=Gossypium arboreum TaxID=29729 RepID=UPI0008196C88|nr:uncharacterized protein LOC108450840 [Gossypium arboreum]
MWELGAKGDSEWPRYVDARRKEFLNLAQGNKTVAEYEAEFLRLSRYASGIVAIEYERSVRFEDGLCDELRVLIASQRERDFAAFVEKAKIAEEVKRTERQNHEKDRPRFRRDSRPPDRRLARTVAECIWGSAGNELGHAFDVSQRNISSESVLGEQFKVKLQNKEGSNSHEEDHHHREAVGYYRRFVERFLVLAAPLTKLLRKGAPFVWTSKQQEAFEKLKKVLTEASVLIQPESGKDFTVYSDASHIGLGCMLMQEGKVDAYASQQLKPHEESELKIESVPVVREFVDVFPEELPGLPPVKEVEFGIELMPGMTPISIALYRMALNKLKELKTQL